MLSESNEERDIRRLIEFIRAKGGEITARKLHRSNPGAHKYRTAGHAELALDSLVSLPGMENGTKSRLARRAESQPDGSV